ncbi:MAG: type IV / vi secretion system, dotu [Variovorax sp.]|nr:MAG: type IV / vi secretion system, dotu [Variovorax sp.]
MPRLLDFFRPVFLLGLELDVAIRQDQARAQQPVSEMQQEALALLEQGRREAMAAGYPPEPLESASFALVAWLDEILARAPSWSARATSLQVQRFNSNNAHSEFFHHLSALQAEDGELREIYWLALAHGFTGQYYFETGDSGELGKLKAMHARQLPLPPLDLATLARDHLTPQPYAAAVPAGPREPERRERSMLRAGGALALLLPLLGMLWWLLAGSRDTPSTLAQQVNQRLQTYTCADLSASVSAAGAAEVRGFVASPEDIQRVRSEISALPGVKSTDVDLALRVWPHCEVVAMLKPYQARNRARQYGLGLQVQGARDGRLREGDLVLVQVTQPGFDGHLWVDYYTADGSVLHFNAGRQSRRLAARERIELGHDIPSSWLVSPPFGTVLVTALASPLPFSDNVDRPPFELASDYLLRLRESLSANKDPDRLVAEFEFFATAER